MKILGIDIGGSGIKGALVETRTGKLVSERLRLDTPSDSAPIKVARVVAELVTLFRWKGVIGCTFPGVIRRGIIYTAANMDKNWIGVNGETVLRRKTRCALHLLNDADAAGIAEMQFGAGKHKSGVVLVLTFGTGIGSALFVDSKLVPNTELGHIELRNKEAEARAAARVRAEKNLSWKEWAKRVNEYLERIEGLFSPDLIIIGGGVSKRSAEFLPLLETRARLVPARFRNDAGIVGAALAAANRRKRR
jgi:polyphosphate glucokinase